MEKIIKGEREKKVHEQLLVLQNKIMSWLKSQGKFEVIIETTKGDVLFTANGKSLFFKDYDDGSYICGGTSNIYKEHTLACLLENEIKVTFIE